jgi:hypothetical protein
VSYGRDDWGSRRSDSTQYNLSIKGTEIVARAAAARKEEYADGVGATAPPLRYGAGIDACNRLCDLFGGTRTLHSAVRDNETSEWSLAAEHPHHVV